MLKEKKKVLSKTLAFVLALVMVIGLMPVTSFAEGEGEVTSVIEEKSSEKKVTEESKGIQEELEEAENVENKQLNDEESIQEVDNKEIEKNESTIENNDVDEEMDLANAMFVNPIAGIIGGALKYLNTVTVEVHTPKLGEEGTEAVMKIDVVYKENIVKIRLKEDHFAEDKAIEMKLSKQQLLALLVNVMKQLEGKEETSKFYVKALMLKFVKDYKLDEKFSVPRIRAFFNSLGYQADEISTLNFKFTNVSSMTTILKEYRNSIKQKKALINPVVKLVLLPKEGFEFKGISYESDTEYEPGDTVENIDLSNLKEIEVAIIKKFNKSEEQILAASININNNVKIAFKKDDFDLSNVEERIVTKDKLVQLFAGILISERNKNITAKQLIKMITKEISTKAGLEANALEQGLRKTFNSMGYQFDEVMKLKVSNKTDITDDGTKAKVVFYLHPKQFEVIFDSQGGTQVQSEMVDYRRRVTEPDAPTKEGHDFKFWYIKPEDGYVPADYFENMKKTSQSRREVEAKLKVAEENYQADKTDENMKKVDELKGEHQAIIKFEEERQFRILKPLTLLAKWDLKKFTVEFDLNGAEGAITEQRVEYNSKATKPVDPSRTGYTFKGWQLDGTEYNFESKVTKSIKLSALWEENAPANTGGSTGGGGGTTGGGDTAGGGGGGGGTLPPTDNNTTIDDNKTPLGAAKENNLAYMHGYKDGTVNPEGAVTREVAAAIFFRLMDEKARAAARSEENSFTDVKKTDWSNKHISTLVKAGILTGYTDGSFQPQKPITRAELASMLVKFYKLEAEKEHKFSDLKGNWAEEFIAALAKKGWVGGYPDGSFLPNKTVSRAELATIINNVLGRKIKKEELPEKLNKFSDLDAGKWYYEALILATTNYVSERKEDGTQKFLETFESLIEM